MVTQSNTLLTKCKKYIYKLYEISDGFLIVLNINRQKKVF